MSIVEPIVNAVHHNVSFTHRYVGVCQICGNSKGCQSIKMYTPPGTALYLESTFGELLYCSKCEDKLPIYSNMFMFVNLIATNISCSTKELKILRSNGSHTSVNFDNCILMFSTSSRKIYFKFKFTDPEKGEVYKANEMEVFFNSNKDIISKDDFTMTIELNKTYLDEEIEEHEAYISRKNIWKNEIVKPLVEKLGSKLIINYN